ncbi:hypothetical protein HWV62_35037 [Athelia sp. TMB]|nr:hypothetical protein HWV62_35037 [Athelia sp. TMB]
MPAMEGSDTHPLAPILSSKLEDQDVEAADNPLELARVLTLDRFEALSLQVKELQATLHESLEENGRLRKKLQVLEARDYAQRSHAAHLPDEVLWLILLRAVSPSVFLDTSHSVPYPSPYARALATKQSIVLTCTQWARVGSQLLYESVCLHYIGPLVAFARTLTLHPALGDLVRGIHIELAVFEEQMEVYTRELQAIFKACPRLEHVGHYVQLPGWEQRLFPQSVGTHIEVHQEAVTRSLDLLPRGLLRLEVSGAWIRLFEQVAVECTALEELSVTLQRDLPTPESYPIKALNLPHLIFLRVCLNGHALIAFARISLNWHTPALARVRLDFYNTFSTHSDSMARQIATFLRAPSRSQITYLNLHMFYDSSVPSPLPLNFLPGACPALTHLVLSAGASLPETPHPAVRHLDLWDSTMYPPGHVNPAGLAFVESVEHIRADAPRAFPNLCTMRTLDRTLPGAADWPRSSHRLQE